MTPLEKEAMLTCIEVMEMLTGRKVAKWDYMIVLGHLRDTIEHLENCERGCPSGKHAGICTCQPDKPGICMNTFLYGRRKR